MIEEEKEEMDDDTNYSKGVQYSLAAPRPYHPVLIVNGHKAVNKKKKYYTGDRIDLEDDIISPLHMSSLPLYLPLSPLPANVPLPMSLDVPTISPRRK